MEHLILWFNIMGFSLLFASLGATFLVYGHTRPGWLKPYLLYLAVYAFFTIFNTYLFFSQVYLPPSDSPFNTIALYLAFFIALVLLLVVPRFIRSLFDVEPGRVRRLLPIAMVVLFFLMMILSRLKPELGLDRAGSVLLNGYLGLVTLEGLYRLRQKKDRSSYGIIFPFLMLSCGFYFFVALLNLLLPLLVSPLLNLQVGLFTAGLICFAWGGVTLVYMLVENFRKADPGLGFGSGPAPGGPDTVDLIEEFFSRSSLTPREREVASLLLQGRSNREIGEELYVSPRTVEAHVYNIYRKCSVKNKLELARRVSATP